MAYFRIFSFWPWNKLSVPKLVSYEIKEDIGMMWTKLLRSYVISGNTRLTTSFTLFGALGIFPVKLKPQALWESETKKKAVLWVREGLLYLPCHYVETFTRWTLCFHRSQRTKRRTVLSFSSIQISRFSHVFWSYFICKVVVSNFVIITFKHVFWTHSYDHCHHQMFIEL